MNIYNDCMWTRRFLIHFSFPIIANNINRQTFNKTKTYVVMRWEMPRRKDSSHSATDTGEMVVNPSTYGPSTMCSRTFNDGFCLESPSRSYTTNLKYQKKKFFKKTLFSWLFLKSFLFLFCCLANLLYEFPTLTFQLDI